MNCEKEWILLPMINNNLTCPNLGGKLSDCLEKLRNNHQINGCVTFIESYCFDIRNQHITDSQNCSFYTNQGIFLFFF